MSEIKFKKCDDILDYLLFLEKKLVSLEEELSSLRFSIFSKKAKERKKLIKCNLKKIYETLEDYDDFLYDATTFQRKDLAMFFSKYFTALYGIKYTVEEDAKDKSEGSTWIPTDIIASERDFARIDKKYNFKRKVNVDDIIDMCQDSCLCLGGPEEYTLLEGTKLSPELEGFPEVADIVKILVDLKLADPTLSDEKRLAFGLKIAISRLNKKTNTYTKPEPVVPTYVQQPIPTPPKPVVPTPQVSIPTPIAEPLTKKEKAEVVEEPLKVRFSEPFRVYSEPPRQPIIEEVKPNTPVSPTPEKVLTKSLMSKYLHHK